jgi:hypothetical protein
MLKSFLCTGIYKNSRYEYQQEVFLFTNILSNFFKFDKIPPSTQSLYKLYVTVYYTNAGR